MDNKNDLYDVPNILLVEDDVDHADLIKRNLKKHGVKNKIFHVADGEEALDFLLRRKKFSNPESSPRPDVVFLDLRIPKIDGLTVLKRIKAKKDLMKIPVVILTTSDDDKDVKSAYDNGANSYIVKPVDYTKFKDLLKDLGYYWLDWNEKPK